MWTPVTVLPVPQNGRRCIHLIFLMTEVLAKTNVMSDKSYQTDRQVDIVIARFVQYPLEREIFRDETIRVHVK